MSEFVDGIWIISNFFSFVVISLIMNWSERFLKSWVNYITWKQCKKNSWIRNSLRCILIGPWCSDLSHNQLTGFVPTNLAQLQNIIEYVSHHTPCTPSFWSLTMTHSRIDLSFNYFLGNLLLDGLPIRWMYVVFSFHFAWPRNSLMIYSRTEKAFQAACPRKKSARSAVAFDDPSAHRLYH